MSDHCSHHSHHGHQNITNDAAGDPLSTKSAVLDTGASMTQDFAPVKDICAFLNAYHTYADEPGRAVEASHYCTHLNEDMRQCLIYDSPDPKARLIGVEYMVSPKLFETLDSEERKLWHSHVFEVKSGMLIMPKPSGVPDVLWEVAENKEMEEVINWYGKTFHFWQVDRGDKVPLGMPKLMAAITNENQVEDFKGLLKKRDDKFGNDSGRKKEKRAYIPEPTIHPDADAQQKK